MGAAPRRALLPALLWYSTFVLTGVLVLPRQAAAGGLFDWASSYMGSSISQPAALRGRRAGPEVSAAPRRLLQVPYAQLGRRLREAGNSSQSLDPCQEQRMLLKQAYVVGVLLWPGANETAWLDGEGRTRNPCTDPEFAQLLADRGAMVAVFLLHVRHHPTPRPHPGPLSLALKLRFQVVRRPFGCEVA